MHRCFLIHFINLIRRDFGLSSQKLLFSLLVPPSIGGAVFLFFLLLLLQVHLLPGVQDGGLPGVQGEGEGGASVGEVEGEFLALVGQCLAEIQALAEQGRVSPSDHLHWTG